MQVGRYIGDSVFLCQDVVGITKIRNRPGMLLFIDFQKAFDTIDIVFIIKAFEKFILSKIIINWIYILQKNATSCVIKRVPAVYSVQIWVLDRETRCHHISFLLAIKLFGHEI